MRRKLALFALFSIPGLAIASWVTRTPTIRDQIHASTAEMGLVLFGLSLGSLAGILCSGPFVARVGARLAITIGMSGLVAGLPVIGLGAVLGSQLLVAIGLAMFGLGMGSAEVAMNVEGGDVERITGRTFLPLLHGFYSLGNVVGAVLGIWLAAISFPVLWHLSIVFAVTLVLLVASVGKLPRDTGRISRPKKAEALARGIKARSDRFRPDARIVLIGLMVMALALAEGAANDWLPLVMVDGHGFPESLGSAIFAVFAFAMMLGRFLGGGLVTRFGRGTVLAASGLFAAAGLLVVSVAENQIAAAVAVILWGLGASLGFPLTLSAAGDSGPNPTQRVALASTLGYIAFLVGPPALGFLGEEFGLRNALLVPMAAALLAVFLAPAARSARPGERDAQE
ncbi:MFS transporter [Gulosibacter chungangensis]|uniref:MFS transporter n=2 Tax=Gulosibacter chungangensis TaxID=979746 RepID=A0A7J5BI63_9MICO|nr:MFS transporter [Gulosibacter chungangensis]